MSNSDSPRESSSRYSLLQRTIYGVVCHAWTAILAIVCFPVYIRLLGMEAFGLIGFYYTLQSILRVLDLGLTPTVIRELARARGHHEPSPVIALKAGTFASLFALGGMAVATILVFAAPLIARQWLRAEAIPVSAVILSLIIIGVQCGINLISLFYQSALLGLERQDSLYGIRFCEASLISLGGLLILTTVSPNVCMFLLWQLTVSTLSLSLYLLAARESVLVPAPFAVFDLSYLHSLRYFLAPMAIITILAIIQTNSDKVLLSHVLPLARFGEYSLATFCAATLYTVLISPIANVMYPRLASVAATDESALANLYHLSMQSFTAATAPMVVLTLFFSHDLLAAWTGSASLADNVAPVLMWLSVGYTCNAMMYAPHHLHLATGRTLISMRLSLMTAAMYLPLLLFSVWGWGEQGAAASYAFMNAAYLCIGLPVTHRHILKGMCWKVAVRDLAPSLIVCSGIGVGLHCLLGAQLNASARLYVAVVTGLIAWSMCALSSRDLRTQILLAQRVWLH